ncbi:uncharacterized protein LOC100187150 [Ciona intestinalis]
MLCATGSPIANQLSGKDDNNANQQPLKVQECSGKTRRRSSKPHRVSVTSEIQRMRIERQISKGTKGTEAFFDEESSMSKIVQENEKFCASYQSEKTELIDFLTDGLDFEKDLVQEVIGQPVITKPEESTTFTGPTSCSVELVGLNGHLWSGSSTIKVLLTTVSDLVMWKLVSSTKVIYVFGIDYNGAYKYATTNGESEKIRFYTATTSPTAIDLDNNDDLNDPRAFKLEADPLSGYDRLVPAMYPTLGVTRGTSNRLYTETLDSSTDNWFINTL